LLLIRLRISQKYLKFRALVLCKGYSLKWAIITLSSDLDLTLNRASLPATDTEPTENNFLIAFNNSKSLIFKVIIKQGSIVQPIAAVLDLNIDILNEPSASENPVTHQGFKVNVSDDICLFVLLYLACLVKFLRIEREL
jgi:hypothetical protein